ncbi:MAG: ABC transporter ATP-binding protein [Gemmataceae bacterium]|nr:ABC transporter ATP-binding protein [Gemmataceae bacterium]
MARIVMEHINLTFRVCPNRVLTFKEFLLGKFLRKKEEDKEIKVHALRNINLEIPQGGRVGIIGHNGAGKSTMLKTLAGIYQPSAGTRIVEGKISSLFEITLGFEPECSGWQNIAFRSYLQGETPTTVAAKKQGIADFSELGSFLGMPVRYYSAGMMVRLAFSIATAVDPEILLIDEVLGAGDLAFLNKAKKRMRDMMDRAHLMVMVSHDLESVRSMCDRVLWMDHGTIRMEGPANQVIEAYQQSMSANVQAA